jgi:alpha-beta hydrolase superfamily lysophospholipase
MARFLDTSLAGFECAAAQARAALIIVHGLAEYAGRYARAMDAFAQRGIHAFAYDQRGHGAAPGPRTHVRRFDDFVTDLGVAVDAVRRIHPRLPLFVWGHSMGSVVATLAAANVSLAGVITSSPSLEIFRRGPDPTSGGYRMVSRVLPRIRIPLGLDPSRISHDESVQRAYGDDPRIPKTASLRLIVEFALACDRSREVAPRITTPWLVVHGEQDQVAPVAGAKVLFDLLGSKDKQLQIYPAARHEVHNELAPVRDPMLALLGDWILARGSA